MRNTKMSTVQSNVKHNNGGHVMSKGMVKQNVGNAAKHAYEATVKIRAIRNAGGCNNLNGHILEVMGADKTYLNPFNGLHETLVKSRTAHAVDSIVTKGGKIVQRVQYKDTAKSIGDTVRRVKDGQYNSVTLKGTSETAKVFNPMQRNTAWSNGCRIPAFHRTQPNLWRAAAARQNRFLWHGQRAWQPSLAALSVARLQEAFH